MAQRLYIDIGKEPFTPRAASSGDATPAIRAILGTQIDLVVAFFKNNTTEALPDGTTGGRFTMKKKGEPNGAALLLDLAWEASGSGAARTYKFSGSLDSTELLDAIGADPEIECEGSVQWTLPSAAKPSKCEDFAITVVNSSSREDDSIPATTDARWAWLKEAAPEANGFTHDDEAKTLAVEAGGITEESDPVASAALATHAARADNPHSVTKAQVGLGNCDNTSDADKPVSSATSAALTGKVPTTRNVNTSGLASGGGALSADRTIDVPLASQAEAEAGSNNTKAMSPLRVAQAIAALAPSGGGGGSISTPNVLWVTSDGNDTTGDGSLAAPYASAQKAFDIAFADSGDCCLKFGVGSFGNVLCNAGWPGRITVSGTPVSHIGNVVLHAASVIRGDGNVIFTTILSDAGSLTVHHVRTSGQVASFGLGGADGTPGDAETPGGDGGAGLPSEAVKAYDSIIGGELGSIGGTGGAGGSDGGAGPGAPGSAAGDGEVTAVRCRLSTLRCGSGLLATTSYDSLSGSITDAGGNASGIPFEA